MVRFHPAGVLESGMALDLMLGCNDHRNGRFLGKADTIDVHGVRLVGGTVTCNWIHGSAPKWAHRVEGAPRGRILIP